MTILDYFSRRLQEIPIAMITFDAVTHTGEHPYKPDAALVYCDLFGDRVAERVCLLLKKELNAWWRCDLACRGCGRRWLR